jgi:hypothetical protein
MSAVQGNLDAIVPRICAHYRQHVDDRTNSGEHNGWFYSARLVNGHRVRTFRLARTRRLQASSQ